MTRNLQARQISRDLPPPTPRSELSLGVILGYFTCTALKFESFTSCNMHTMHACSKEKLRNAAKARIRRMIQAKKTRTDLNVPDWVAKEFAKGTVERDRMADVLQEVNWSKAGQFNFERRKCCSNSGRKKKFFFSIRTCSLMRWKRSSQTRALSVWKRMQAGIQKRRWKTSLAGPRSWPSWTCKCVQLNELDNPLIFSMLFWVLS